MHHSILGDIFHKFDSIPVFIITQYENLSATNGHMVAIFYMPEKTQTKV